MSQHIGPRTISATGGSIKRVGNYRIHTFPSEIVTDGLVLNLDAGDPRSYPSSGTTWTDLSGNGNTGTLVNGPTYDNSDGGGFNFVSTSSTRIDIDSVPQVTGDYTVEIWFKSTSVVNYKNICDMNYGVHQADTGPRLEQNSTGMLRWYTTASITGTTNNTIDLSSTLVAGTIYHAVITYDSKNKTYSGYLNGNQSIANQTQLYGGDIPFDGIKLGVGYSNTRFFDGNIYSFKIYNRALSAAEVAQNYDALRVRYGSYTNTFTPLCGGGEGKVEVLCVAGGGAGGGYHGGGGGGGGVIYSSSHSITPGSAITATVGAGGAAPTSVRNTGNPGGNSVFGALTAIGGGAGISQSNEAQARNNGGSGGGGCDGSVSVNHPGGSGTSGQGFKGGDVFGSGTQLAVWYGTAGGGGAGGVGGDGGVINGGFGGPGLPSSISGTSTYYAGGGGGPHLGSSSITNYGIGGIGGGGTGGISPNPHNSAFRSSTSGSPNTGGGGGGQLHNGLGGGAGGSGVVIVRYPATDYNVEVLVVGGGGGGGHDTGGGGGAGGLIYHSSYPVSSGKKLQVTVGKGGPWAATTAANATSGDNSIFNDQVAIGGGYGSSNASLSPGGNGGSGGGGGAYSGYQGVGGTGVPGQGNSGGTAIASAGGGGGGSGSAGYGGDTTANGDLASDGGDGLTYSITGSSVVYAAGGGGGQNTSDNRGTGGSSGVGGDGGTVTRNPTDPDANTGSGGGGGSSGNQPSGNRAGTSGADGIIIIAYKGPQRGIGGIVDTTSRPGYTLHKFTTTGTDFFTP